MTKKPEITSWIHVLPALLALYDDKKPDSLVSKELQEMARIADKYENLLKKEKLM